MIYITQRNSRHIIKRLSKINNAYQFDGACFGVYGKRQSGSKGLNFPYQVVSDGTYIYVCDSVNRTSLIPPIVYHARIVKLTKNLVFVDSLDFSSIGEPKTMFYDSHTPFSPFNPSLYVACVSNHASIAIAQIDLTSFSIIKSRSNMVLSHFKIPFALSRGFFCNDFILSGLDQLYYFAELSTSFSDMSSQTIVGESGAALRGHIKHSNGNIYIIAQGPNKASIVSVNNGYISIGASSIISKQCTYITEGLDNTVLVYDSANMKILRFDANLALIEVIATNSGKSIAADLYDVSGLLEI
jgi:hypothetical protein